MMAMALLALAAPALAAPAVVAGAAPEVQALRRSSPPHILWVVCDDLGYTDVSYHGAEFETPTVDALARAGVRLENYYVQLVCSPTRTSFMTGRYPLHTGFQHIVIFQDQDAAIDRDHPTVAEALKARHNYSCALVGKWHNGHNTWESTPLGRGFDIWYGWNGGSGDYYHHTIGAQVAHDGHEHKGFAMFDGLDGWTEAGPMPDWSADGNYSTDLWTDVSIGIIDRHFDTGSDAAINKQPLFLYLAYQAPHAPVQPSPDPDLNAHCKKIASSAPGAPAGRDVYCSMVSRMDADLAKVVSAMKAVGAWENTFTIFTTDNGGCMPGENRGCNAPLRGGKHHLFEGGIRGTGFVHSELLPLEVKGKSLYSLMHAVDWMPTLLGIAGPPTIPAGGPLQPYSKWRGELHDLDGFNMWPTIQNVSNYDVQTILAPSPRNEIPHNVDPLIPVGTGQHPSTPEGALRLGQYKLLVGDLNIGWLSCNMTLEHPPANQGRDGTFMLFDLLADQEERHDLSSDPAHSATFDQLLARYHHWVTEAVPPHYPPSDNKSYPECQAPQYRDGPLAYGSWPPWQGERPINGAPPAPAPNPSPEPPNPLPSPPPPPKRLPPSGSVFFNMTNMRGAGACGKNDSKTKVLDFGEYQTWNACQTVCDNNPSLCVTWSWHNINEGGCFKGQCFLRGTHVWDPWPNSNHAVCGVRTNPAKTGSKQHQLKTDETLVPRSYWRFESPAGKDMDWEDAQNSTALLGRENGDPNNDAQPWFPNELGGVVGGFIGLSDQDIASGVSNESTAGWFRAEGGCVPFETKIDPKTNRTVRCDGGANPKEIDGVTIEMLVKLGSARGAPSFSSDPYGVGCAGCVLSMAFGDASITFGVKTSEPAQGQSTGVPVDDMSIRLEGIGVASVDYLYDNSWHHLAFRKNARSGEQSIWIDGQSPEPFRLAGNATGRVIKSGGTTLFGIPGVRNFTRGAFPRNFTTNPEDRVASVGFDELAIWETPLSDAMIFQHFQDSLVHHRPYTTGSDSGLPPAPAPAAWNASFDLKEFARGTILPTAPGNATKGASDSCDLQLSQYPATRLVTSAKMRPNVNWMDPHYLGGSGQVGISVENMTANAEAIQTLLVTKFNFGLVLWFPAGDTSTLSNATMDLANAHPSWPLHVVIPGRGGGKQIHNQSLPSGCYLQDAAGSFITMDGKPAGSKKVLRITTPELAEAVGCPDSLFDSDGEHTLSMFKVADQRLIRPINLINEDGEIFESLGQLYSNTNTSVCKDPKVQAAFEKDDAPDWDTFESKWRLRLTARFRDIFLQSGLASLKGAAYSQYQVQGTNKDVENYYGNWTYTRKIGTPFKKHSGTGSSYYSTIDLYPGNCWNSYCSWFKGAGAWHSLSMLDSDRPTAESLGDHLFSPFVAAGWSIQSERNIRPAQWLGMLKLIAIWGAEFYYAGFFSLGVPFSPSQNWCYQAAMPAYAQAISSSYADILFDDASRPVLAGFQGAYQPGREPTFGPNAPVSSSPWLWAGAPNRIAVARKASSSKELYVIAGAVERKSNQQGNSRAVANASVLLPTGSGAEKADRKLQFEVRLQGSVYVYDATVPQPKFYQIDGWHEPQHPSYWSSHRNVEAELFRGHLRGNRTLIHTEVPQGTPAGDYREFTTFVATCGGNVGNETHLVYDVPPGRWIWLRMRVSRACAFDVQAAEGASPTEVRVGGKIASVWVSVDEWEWTRVVDGSRSSQSELRLALAGAAVDVDRLIATDDNDFSPLMLG